MLDPNQPGSTSTKLSWIWLHSQTARSVVGDLDDNASTEQRWEFNRVHWMRARALSMRWAEEVKLVTHEMSWTVRGFSQKSKLWLADIDRFDMSPGARAYAFRQAAFWAELADQAQDVRVNSVYRAFADSLALADDAELPIPFDPRWRSNMIHNPAVRFQYHKQWWTQQRFPHPDDYMNVPSLADALAYHKYWDERTFE
ncbi:hypothetical protein CVT24_008141, partial [Panaeolus cyanescens]